MRRYIPIAIATFIWIWPPVLIKMLSFHFDVYTQNFYRYLAGSSVLMVISLIYRKRKLFSSLKRIKKFILPAMLVFLYQISFVGGIYLLTPTVASLIGKSSVLFTTLFSFVLFSDERKIIRSRSFIAGSLLAILGVYGVIAGKGSVELAGFNLGAVLILIGSVMWSLYTIVVKVMVREVDPFELASIVFMLSLPLFFIFALLFGDMKALKVAPKGIVAILFLSGALCVGIANAFNYKSIKLIGTVISSNLILLTPFFTAIASYLIFKETLSIYQILSGAALLAGCSILVTANRSSENNHKALNGR